MVKEIRYALGVWLLKPYWLPMLEHYTKLADPKANPQGARNCANICIGIKNVLKASRRYRTK